MITFYKNHKQCRKKIAGNLKRNMEDTVAKRNLGITIYQTRKVYHLFRSSVLVVV